MGDEVLVGRGVIENFDVICGLDIELVSRSGSCGGINAQESRDLPQDSILEHSPPIQL
jgi:hypothetical protein